MKKIFKILPLLLTGAVAFPVATTLSSCAPSTEYYIKYLDFDKIDHDKPTDLWTWNDMSSPNVSLKKLLYGTKKFHDGNYAILLGTPTANSSDKKTSKTFDFIFSNAHTSTYDIDDFNLNNSYLYQAWFSTKTQIESFAGGIGFVTLMDLWNDSSDGPRSVISPFAKWTEAQDDFFNRDHTDLHPEHNMKVKKDTWIRNDEGAKLFRNYVNEITTLFPDFETKFLSDSSSSDTWDAIPGESASTSCVDNAPYIIFWKDGKPQAAKTINTSSVEDLEKQILDIYNKTPDKPDNKPTDNTTN